MGAKSGEQAVGNAYYMGLAYALCTKIDSLDRFMIDDDDMCLPYMLPNGTGVFMARTGVLSEQYPSDNPFSFIQCYNGEQITPDLYLTLKTGQALSYRNTAYLVFNGFIGDNVRSAPNYAVVARRTNLNMLTSTPHEDINRCANPAAVIKYIFVKMLGVDENLIDQQSFDDVGVRLFDEQLGISFVMSEAKEAKEWIEEILRTIDGALVLDKKTGKIKLRLLRGDYDINSVPVIDATKMRDLKFNRKGWESCYSNLVVKYTDMNTFDSNTVEFSNPATKAILGYNKSFSTSYMMIRNTVALSGVIERLVKKMCYPWASLKFSVSINDFPNIAVGDVFKFSNDKLGVYNMPIRVMGIGGDKEESQKIEIEATEDMYSLTLDKQITQIKSEKMSVPINYDIDETSEINIAAIQAPPEMGELRGVYPLCAYPKGLIQSATCSDGDTGAKVRVDNCAIGTLLENYPVTDVIDEFVGFKVKAISDFWEVSATRAGWQRLKMGVVIDSEVMAFEYRKNIEANNWEITNIIRGLAGSKIVEHKKGAKVWFMTKDLNECKTLSCIGRNSTLKFSFKNQKAEVNKSLNVTLSDENYKPYAPSNLSAVRNGDKVELKWRNRIKLGGANYRNIDNLPAGADEGKIDGYVMIEWAGGSTKCYEDNITITAPKNTTFSIYAIGEHGLAYPSDKATITA